MKEPLGEYGPNDYDVFNPDEVAQTVFVIVVDKNTLGFYKANNKTPPDGLMERLHFNESYVREQVRRWGMKVIDEGLDMIGEGRPQWGEIQDIFPPDNKDKIESI